MYFPYLRGRQFELLAIRELVGNDLIGSKVIPIIEPVKLTSTLVTTLEVCTSKARLHALVMNPTVGDFLAHVKERKNNGDKNLSIINEQLNSKYLIKAYIMKPKTVATLKNKPEYKKFMIVNPNRDCIDDFVSVYTGVEPVYTLIPDDRTFGRKAPNSKVLFVDRFSKTLRNSDYLKNEDEFFSEDHMYYSQEGFKGFSDFTVVGSDYSESGFAPLAVAIHIVYFDKDKILRVHHFVSDSNDDINDPAGKFGEAVQKLVKWVNVTKAVKTKGLEGIMECHSTGKYPGLGTVKKYSIMHHLELMDKFLEGEI